MFPAGRAGTLGLEVSVLRSAAFLAAQVRPQCCRNPRGDFLFDTEGVGRLALEVAAPERAVVVRVDQFHADRQIAAALDDCGR